MKSSAKPLRFILVGIANTAIDFFVLFGLTALGVELILANMISTSIALTFSFFFNRSFTFRSSGRKTTQIFGFLAVTLAGLWVLQPIILVFFVPLLTPVIGRDLSIIGSKMLATVVSMVWNYLLYDSLVFEKR